VTQDCVGGAGHPKPLGMNPHALQHRSGSQGEEERSFPFGRRGGFPTQGHKWPSQAGSPCLLPQQLSPHGKQLPRKNLRSFLQTFQTHHTARSSPSHHQEVVCHTNKAQAPHLVTSCRHGMGTHPSEKVPGRHWCHKECGEPSRGRGWTGETSRKET